MGAAVELDSGEVTTGAVVENVSLGLAMCAERIALFCAVAAGGRPRRLALVSARTDGKLTYPCGACLALEFGGPELEVVISDDEGATDRAPLGELLPRGPRKAR